MATSACTGENNSPNGFVIGEMLMRYESTSTTNTLSMAVAQTATQVLPGVLENTIDPSLPKKPIMDSFVL